jgi:hypothetical protein
MPPNLAAEVGRLKAAGKWKRFNAVTQAQPLDGGVKVGETVYTRQEIDLEEAFDRATTAEEAVAIATELRAFDARRAQVQTTTRHRGPRPQGIGIRRRTCTGGRRRPGARRTSRSTASSGGAESDSDGPGERPRRLLLLGVRDRRLADSLSRIGAIR